MRAADSIWRRGSVRGPVQRAHGSQLGSISSVRKNPLSATPAGVAFAVLLYEVDCDRAIPLWEYRALTSGKKEPEGHREPGSTAGAAGPWSNEMSGTVLGPSVQAGSIHGGVRVTMTTPPTPQPVPVQLPSSGFFTNRRAELRRLQELADSSAGARTRQLVVVNGPGGVGKTTLVLRWLQQIRDEYDAGQLFVDLRGFSGGRPMMASEPLERFLRGLGVNADGIPTDVDEQAAMFRSLTADRRLIVLLDNAVSASQVRPLLPGPGPALVVVTTRQRLSGLVTDGAAFLDLPPLNEAGAIELLEGMLGADRVGSEPDHTASLAALCGRLPLALCASGARLAVRRRWPIARAVRELSDETRRLSALRAEDGDMSVQAVFNASYRALDDEGVRRMYRLLGLFPGADFSVSVAAAMANVDDETTADLLDTLVGASLLGETGHERFSFHDLVRLHARGKAREEESPSECQAAVDRLFDWYLAMAAAADLAVLPGRWRLGTYYSAEHRERLGRVAFRDGGAALEWMEVERSNLMALIDHAHQHGAYDAAWQMCEAMWPLFLLHKHYNLWIEAHQVGLDAARASRNQKAEARMLVALGYARLSLGEYDAAVRECAEALHIDEEASHLLGQASALEYLGIAALRTGRPEQAIGYFARALELDERVDHPRGVAMMRRHIGDAHAQVGRYAAAIDEFAHALGFFSVHHEPYHEARTLTRLGNAHLRAGSLDTAEDTLTSALGIAEGIGALHEEAAVHVAFADLAAQRGDHKTERVRLGRAVEIFDALGVEQAGEIRRRLAAIPPAADGPDTSPSR